MTEPGQHSGGSPARTPVQEAVLKAFGDRRGAVEAGVPAAVFVIANALGGLRAGVVAALLCGVALGLVRLARHEPAQSALSGLLGVAIAAFLAARSGKAESFFLPGIVINAVYALGLGVSLLARRPLVGVLLAAVEGLGATWRSDRRLVRATTLATVGWLAVFALRAVVQTLLYLAHRPGWLAVARIGLGLPLYVGMLAVTMALVGRVQRTAAVTEAPTAAR